MNHAKVRRILIRRNQRIQVFSFKKEMLLEKKSDETNGFREWS